jgi:hypothetical protein
LYSCEMSRLV